MEMQDIGLSIFGERFEDTRLYLCQKYWELSGKMSGQAQRTLS